MPPRRKTRPAEKNPQEEASMTSSAVPTKISKKDAAYRELESQLKSVQAQRNQDLQTTQSQLLDIDTKLKELDPCLDNLEAKAVQSMQYHVDTNQALTNVQSQMSQMMEMMQNIMRTRPNQDGYPYNHDGALPSSSLAAVNHNTPATSAHLIVEVPSTQDTRHHEGSCSVASSSSGSQHEQPPPKKTLKRSMPDATDKMHLDTCTIDDDASSSSFNSTPPIYPLSAPTTPSPLQLEREHSLQSQRTSEMDTENTNPTHLAMPDLEDQYKLSDEQQSSNNTSPDGGTNG
ncbi:hypothetical protein MHU86_10869 [Fragilaria crotonensis]|nr:hypothetical protein MHU86_10869 [Fragilaria crotonensis]